MLRDAGPLRLFLALHSKFGFVGKKIVSFRHELLVDFVQNRDKKSPTLPAEIKDINHRLVKEAGSCWSKAAECLQEICNAQAENIGEWCQKGQRW